MSEDPNVDAARSLARRNFPEFYRIAQDFEREALDSLVLSFATTGLGITIPRPLLNEKERPQLERITDASERVYTELCQVIRVCPAFTKIPAAERERIERELLRVPKWWFEQG